MGEVRFDGQVVIVTGAGGGLGRDYALAFAKRGASVVVNDLGGGRAGDGGGSRMADSVVGEIRAGGGKAVPNYDSVENGPAIVKTAIDNYGRVDVVVNNAGILRDKSFGNMSDLDWDLIQRVHLKGSWSVAKAAWPHMRTQKYGRVINTSSNSGIYGNFGQANYSAAKMGVIGLTNTMAIEGAKYGIQVNAYIPTAGSRLTEDIMPAEMFAALRTDYSVPLVLFLASKDSNDTGGVFEAAAGWFGQLQWYRSKGLAFGKNGATVEQVRDAWEDIKNMNGARHFTSGTEVGMDLVEKVNAPIRTPKSLSAKATSSTNPELAKAHTFPKMDFTYTAKDAILYALGVGAETVPDIRYLYESEDGFDVLPTFSVVAGLGATAGLGSAPGLNVDFAKLLHGEQYLELYQPFTPEGRLTSEAKIVDVLDKGSGAAILLQDETVSQKTSAHQATLYRQASGDYNPIHIDDAFAKLSGFKQPIMHGLCTLGFAVRHVLGQFGGNDAAAFKAVKARFSKPVIPGQTLMTEMWKEGKRVHFQTKVAETGEVAISGAYVDLKTEAAEEKDPSGSELGSAEVFKQLGQRAKDQPEIAKKVNAVFLWVITKDGKAFMSGKLKLKGNIMLTQKLQALLKDQAKL